MNPPEDLEGALNYANNAANGLARELANLDKPNAKAVLDGLFGTIIEQYQYRHPDDSAAEQDMATELREDLAAL